jgi:alanine racemase
MKKKLRVVEMEMDPAIAGPKAFLRRSHQVETELAQRVVVELNSRALVKNYQAIQELVPGQALLPMVKADGYGHDAGWVAKHLVSQLNLYGFGVATLDEGAQLRAEMGIRGRKTPIIVFSDTTPWSEEKGQFCELHGLRAVIATDQDWLHFMKGDWKSRVPYELMFNTGMNRLGMSLSFLSRLTKDLRSIPAEHHPQGIFSHLAMSEAAESKLSQLQLDQFRTIRRDLGKIAPGAQFHLANSGGIWNQKSFQLKDLTDVVRPGLSLYGIPPWAGAPSKGILPVLTLRASVIAVHRLKPGDSMGYGGTFRVTGKDPVYAAILSAGYADGIKRALSNRGHAWLEGKSTRFLGNVSMDLCAVQCTPETQIGSWAEILGPQVDPWAQAKAADTIPYELLTSLSVRVKREYDPNSSRT